MKPSWKKTGRTVFHTAMQPLVMLILLQAAILLVSLYLSGIFSQVNSNERSILGKQVVNRANYLEIQMTQQWSDITELAQSINRKTQAAIEQGAIRLDLLENDSKEASKLIGMICTDMIETMYRNKNSGIYVIFNTSSLDGNVEPKTGFHVRDFDPTVNATTQYSDLLLECAPISTVKAMNNSTDTGWDTRYDFGTAYGDYFRKPFMEAYRAMRKLQAVDYACWNSSAQSSLPSGLTYSMPLMLEDGTLYGVLGVELLDDYVGDSLPYDELGFGTDGAYMLALIDKETNRAPLTMVSGSARRMTISMPSAMGVSAETSSTSPSSRMIWFFSKNSPTVLARVSAETILPVSLTVICALGGSRMPDVQTSVMAMSAAALAATLT